MPTPPPQPSPAVLAQALVAAIDQRLTAQLGPVLRHPGLQALEGRWLGLAALLDAVPDGGGCRVRLLDLAPGDLASHLQRFEGVAWDQSPLFRRLHDEGFGQLGGQPWGCLLLDHEFDQRPGDLACLAALARLAAAAHAPCLTGAGPGLVHWPAWSDLPRSRDAWRQVRALATPGWQGLRARDDARYLVLALPRGRARPARGWPGAESRGWHWVDRPDDPGAELWCNAVWGLGCRLLRGLPHEGWGLGPGAPSPGRALPRPRRQAWPGCRRGWDLAPASELPLSPAWVAAFAQQGLLAWPGEESPALAGAGGVTDAPTLWRDPAGAGLSLPDLLACCRVAHHLKVLLRDRLGQGEGPVALQAQLESWLSRWVLANPEAADGSMRARRPFVAAQVRLDPVPGAPGHWQAALLLQRHRHRPGLRLQWPVQAPWPG